MTIKHESEKGQAIVFLVLGLVVFMGFVALTIDGGMAFADRRHSQNGSDAASLAGGGEAALYMENAHVYYTEWNCNSGDIQEAMAIARAAAIERAGSNEFDIDTDPADGNGVTTVCGEQDYGYLDRYIDVTVNISSTTETSFAQLLFPDALVNQVQAVTRVRPRMPLAYGHAIVALNTAECSGNQNGAIFGGSGDTYINGGGIWSNGCLKGNGSTYEALVDNGGVSYVGATDGTMNFIPTEQQVPYALPPSSFEMPVPDCSHPDAHNVNNLPHVMDPGLWCVNGTVHINANTEYWGEGVTIYILDGDLVVNGNAVVHLSAPNADPDPSPAVAGLLFYVPDGDVTINGNSEQWYVGMIYAPGPDPNGTCQINGQSDTNFTIHTQVVCWNVEVTGNARVDINFNAGENYQKPTSIELYR